MQKSDPPIFTFRVCIFTTDVKPREEVWAGRGFRILQQISAGGKNGAARRNPEGGGGGIFLGEQVHRSYTYQEQLPASV